MPGKEVIFHLNRYRVNRLPVLLNNGSLAYARNGRKQGETAGSGTGVIVYGSGGKWYRVSDDTEVQA